MNAAPWDGRLRVLLVPGLVVALVAVTAAAVFWDRGKGTRCGPTASNTNEAASTDRTLSWPTYFYNAFDMTIPLPPGMRVCEDGDKGFLVRNDVCGSSTKASFTVRRNVAWDAMDATAAFNDAYGQQLKEAGLETIDGRGVPLGGKPVSVHRYDFSDTFAGAMATESLNSRPASKKVAIDINRDVPPYANGVLDTDGTELSTDELTRLFLQHIVLTSAAAGRPAATTTSEWTTLNEAAAGFSISFPTDSAVYEPTIPAVLAVTFGDQARLEVRTGTTVDSTRGSLEGYRKLTEKGIVVNETTVIEERYVPKDLPGSSQRLLFVPFTRGIRTVGVSFIYSGDPVEETRFKTILGTFAFSGA